MSDYMSLNRKYREGTNVLFFLIRLHFMIKIEPNLGYFKCLT